jgi:gamma-glutamyl-gamma-aminobutyrate hydrolase PuuD
MKIQFLFALFGLCAYLFSFSSIASSGLDRCSLDRKETLQIACTYQCNKWVIRGLYRQAKRNGYNIKVSNIFNKSVDLKSFDAFILPGGADINPSYYINEVIEPQLRDLIRKRDYLVNYSVEGKKRDPFEYNFLKKYFADQSMKSTPVLGICRGMQMLTVSQGIPLYIDIKTEFGISNRIWKLDKTRMNTRNSVVSKLMRRKKFRAVELHHQGLRLDYFRRHKEKWPHLAVTGTSNRDRIAEVLEFSNRPVLGVQFHPEYTFGRVRRSIFNWVLRSACHNHNQQKEGQI